MALTGISAFTSFDLPETGRQLGEAVAPRIAAALRDRPLGLGLSTEHLSFCPHRFNVQLATWSVRRADITGLRVEGERLPLVTHAGAAEPAWFAVPDPPQAARAIGRAFAG